MFTLNSNIYICNTSGKLLFLFHRVDADTEPITEPKFIVFYSMLLAVFKIFCFVSKSPNPSVEMATNGTMITVTLNCRSCGPTKRFKWMSQPLVLGRYPAGNLLLSFDTITSGVNISQKLLLFKHKGLCTIWCMYYLVYVLFGVCTIWCMYYLVYVLFGVCTIWCMYYLVYVLFGVCTIWCMYYLVYVLFGLCTIWFMYYLVYVLFGLCTIWCMYYLV